MSPTVTSSSPSAATSDFVEALIETSPAMLWMGDENGKCVFLNAALRDFWGVKPAKLDEFDWSSTVHPDDVDKLASPFLKAMTERTPFAVEARYRRADGVYRTMRTVANPRFAPSGEFLGMTGVNTDITEQIIAEEHSQFLLAELNHRTRNMLSIVQAVARKTAADGSSEEFLRSFEARLQGLAMSNDLLLTKEWAGIQLGDLVTGQMSLFGAFVHERLTVVGGPEISLASREAQVLGMALHELTTNSIKYGAFADEKGKVVLTWARNEDLTWQLQWKETVSTPPVRPTRRGFGHVVLVDMVSSALNGKVTTDFPESGFFWRLVSSHQG